MLSISAQSSVRKLIKFISSWTNFKMHRPTNLRKGNGLFQIFFKHITPLLLEKIYIFVLDQNKSSHMSLVCALPFQLERAKCNCSCCKT